MRVVAARDAEDSPPSRPRGAGNGRRPTGATCDRPEVDLVDVTTPNDVHAEQAIAALEAGKHVACEKPLAGTLDDARRMADAARSSPARPSSGTATGGCRPSAWPAA